MGALRRWRSAVTGHFTTQTAAELRPSTHVREYVRAREPELLAQAWHKSLEQLAAEWIGEPVRPWDQLPVENRRLLVAVAKDLQDRGVV